MTTQQVLYRKWRPQRLEDVVGQSPITQTLLNALERERVGHAYLFCGPRGTGKTSTARILAMALNCENNEGKSEPCGTCPTCKEIAAGSYMDLVEIDAATNRGIDEARDLREKVDFMPAGGRVKVYIIDEVHMMTAPAFNALLKTLEEPPAHAYFILATTEPHRIPLTIASRCQRFDFRRIANEDAASRLRRIADAESFDIEPAALDAVVRASTGSLRDASNLLEQVVLASGSRATLEDAREMLGLGGSTRARGLIDALLLDHDLAEALKGIVRLQADGMDMKQVHVELVEELRTLMIVGAGAEEVLDLPDDQLADLRQAAARVDLGSVRSALATIAPLSVPSGGLPLPLEIAFADIYLRNSARKEGESGGAPDDAAVASVAAASPTEPTPPPPSPPPPARAPTPPAAGPPTAGPENEPARPPVFSPPILAPTPLPPAERAPTPETETGGTTGIADPATHAALAAGADLDLDSLRSRWKELVDGLRGVGSSGNLDAFLRTSSIPIAIEDDTLVIGFYADFHKKKIEDIKYRRLVELSFAKTLGKHYEIRCERIERTAPSGHLVSAAIERGATLVESESTDVVDDGDDVPLPTGPDPGPQ